MNSLPPFARVIKEQRDRLQMSRSRLAEAAELSYPYISQLETGLRKPSRNAARAIAGALGIGVEDLERTIPADVNDMSQLREAQQFSERLMRLSDRDGAEQDVIPAIANALAPDSAPGSRDELIGEIINLLEAFDSSERFDVLAEVQRRAMQRMMDQGSRGDS